MKAEAIASQVAESTNEGVIVPASGCYYVIRLESILVLGRVVSKSVVNGIVVQFYKSIALTSKLHFKPWGKPESEVTKECSC